MKYAATNLGKIAQFHNFKCFPDCHSGVKKLVIAPEESAAFMKKTSSTNQVFRTKAVKALIHPSS
jgi:hypothetical protein